MQPVTAVSVPTDFVLKGRVRGSYDDLCKKLGQELFEDVVKIRCVIDLLGPGLIEQMQTCEGKELLENIVDKLRQFEQRLTPEQRRLRDACKYMNFPQHTSRPTWANGAHLFVTASVASEIESVFQPGQLCKGDFIVSPEYLEDFVQAITAGADADGVEYRSFVQEPPSEVALTPISERDAALAREDANMRGLHGRLGLFLGSGALARLTTSKLEMFESMDTVSLASRKTHSTGSLPHGGDACAKSWGRAPHKHKARAHEFINQSNEDNSMGFDVRDPSDGEGSQDEEGESESSDDPLSTKGQSTLSDQGEWAIAPAVPPKQQRPPIKNAKAFAAYIGGHMNRLLPEVVQPLLAALPLEASLALPCSGHDDISIEKALEDVFKAVVEVAGTCFRFKFLKEFLRASLPDPSAPEGLLRGFSESAKILAKSLAKSLESLAKSLRSAVCETAAKLKSGGASSSADSLPCLQSGAHVVASYHRKFVATMVESALGQIDVGALAFEAWTQQKDGQRAETKLKVRETVEDVAEVRTRTGKMNKKAMAMKSMRRSGMMTIPGHMQAAAGQRALHAFIIPEKCIGYVIGKGGATIKKIQEESGTLTTVKKYQDVGLVQICHGTGAAKAKQTIERIVRERSNASDLTRPQIARARKDFPNAQPLGHSEWVR